MRTPSPLCGSLLVALLAGSLGVQAQIAPTYRAPATTAAPSQSTMTTSAAPAQCAGAPAPAGATLVGKGNANAPAPSGGQASYSQTRLNLANYAVGGLLTIQITAGNGSAASFELFSGNVTFPSNGAPSAKPLAAQMNVAAGSCATLTLNFSQAGGFILAATGASGASTFQYAAYVQPSFAGVFSPTSAAPRAETQPTQPSQTASQPSQPGSPAQSIQGPGLFTGVFTTTPATNPPASTPPPSPTNQLTQSTQQSSASSPTQPAQLAPSPAGPAPSAVQISPSSAPSTPAPAQPSSPTPSQPDSPSSMNTPMLIQTVTIQNSPGVPDTGGHCIICGLMTGNLTAVEPNLVICVTPNGQTDERSCTGICNPGHDCQAPLSRQLTLMPSNYSVHVEVLDNDKQGKIQQLAAFDEKDATRCTTDQPCKVDDSDDQGAGTLVSFGFGTGCEASAASSASGSIWAEGPVLVASTMFPSGSLPAQAYRTSAQGCPAKELTFTSYFGGINSRQLYGAYQSLYNGSKAFRDLMSYVRFRVNVVVVDASSPQYALLSCLGVAAYKNFIKNNPVNSAEDRGYTLPDPNEFAFTVPDGHGAVNVVISATTLEYGYYPGFSPGKPLLPENLLPRLEPIQLILAYELGTNVAGIAQNPGYTETPRQTMTNIIMKQAFPSFIPNESSVIGTDGKPYAISGAEYYINDAIHQHGVYDQASGNFFQRFSKTPPRNPPDPPFPPDSIDKNGGTGNAIGNLYLPSCK